MKREITVLSMAALALAGCDAEASAPETPLSTKASPKVAAAAPDIAACDAQHEHHPKAIIAASRRPVSLGQLGRASKAR